jgi:hypothetical protein
MSSWVFDAFELALLCFTLLLLSPLIIVGALSDWIEEKTRIDSYDYD